MGISPRSKWEILLPPLPAFTDKESIRLEQTKAKNFPGGESSQLAVKNLFSQRACNSLFIRYNPTHGNHASAKRGHRLSLQLHSEERLLPFLRGDRQRPRPQLSCHRAQARHQSPEQRPPPARPQPQPFY